METFTTIAQWAKTIKPTLKGEFMICHSSKYGPVDNAFLKLKKIHIYFSVYLVFEVCDFVSLKFEV